MSKLTPMMQQYLSIKGAYPDALLFYRMGDFYELFMEDAEVAAGILDIALTSRDKNAEDPVPMCGVPYHAADGYINRLVAAGRKVAICEQVEDPKKAKGLVRREVVRVITPGLIVESENLAAKQPNYLASVASSGRGFGLSYIDISTGEFRVVELDGEPALVDELARVGPRELLIPEGDDPAWLRELGRAGEITVNRLDRDAFSKGRSEQRLAEHFAVHSLDGFGVRGMDLAVSAAGAILCYLKANGLESCGHVKQLLPLDRSRTMNLDDATVRNLELFHSASFEGRKGSLLWVLDLTRTAMGGRKLQQWLRYPLLDRAEIETRQQAVAELFGQPALRSGLIERLGRVKDIERINGRISIGTAGPRDLVALRESLELLPLLRESVTGCSSPLAADLAAGWDDLEDVTEEIAQTLVDQPSASVSVGGVIREGVDPELDRYTRLSRDAKGWMAEYEMREREQTGISSLKVRFNKVFGYFIEVSRANLEAVPERYMRKQTLVNAERFITEELKTFEDQVLEADEKRLELEQQLFARLRASVAERAGRIQAMAERVAVLDCVAALAEAAARYDYTCPQVDESRSIYLYDGRHPVIERFLAEGSYVPNDVTLDSEHHQVLIITGPNMAGKSTILRQVALIALMAQVGSFVPAREARLGLVDRIFTRVGAADDLARGRSTFMVEMQEAANILHQATPRSLVILDEIGRGTSTFDGLSIAWAAAEYLHDRHQMGVRTLFATHYHQLTELAATLPRVKNFNVAVKERGGEIIFFHKLVPGGTSKSYGIQVARLAGLPHEVIERAQAVLAQIENGTPVPLPGPAATTKRGRRPRERRPEAGLQLGLFKPSSEWLTAQILALDLDHLTPFAALKALYAIKEQLRDENRSSALNGSEPQQLGTGEQVKRNG